LQTVLETDRARILSSLIRTCGGDFDLAEEALHDAARADFYRTAGRWGEAEDAYRHAVALATNDPERRFLRGRLQEVRNARLD
jgi:predicted RNA polymerase sigma factor